MLINETFVELEIINSLFIIFNIQKEWLEKFEEAKKIYLSGQNKKRNSVSVEPKSPTRSNSTELSSDGTICTISFVTS